MLNRAIKFINKYHPNPVEDVALFIELIFATILMYQHLFLLDKGLLYLHVGIGARLVVFVVQAIRWTKGRKSGNHVFYGLIDFNSRFPSIATAVALVGSYAIAFYPIMIK